jgi:hypothetical protein
MRSVLIAIARLLRMAPAAGAASIAYVDAGDVWLSSLDGTQKVRLATPVVNGAGNTEKWLAVAASDTAMQASMIAVLRMSSLLVGSPKTGRSNPPALARRSRRPRRHAPCALGSAHQSARSRFCSRREWATTSAAPPSASCSISSGCAQRTARHGDRRLHAHHGVRVHSGVAITSTPRR